MLIPGWCCWSLRTCPALGRLPLAPVQGCSLVRALPAPQELSNGLGTCPGCDLGTFPRGSPWPGPWACAMLGFSMLGESCDLSEQLCCLQPPAALVSHPVPGQGAEPPVLAVLWVHPDGSEKQLRRLRLAGEPGRTFCIPARGT